MWGREPTTRDSPNRITPWINKPMEARMMRFYRAVMRSLLQSAALITAIAGLLRAIWPNGIFH